MNFLNNIKKTYHNIIIIKRTFVSSKAPPPNTNPLKLLIESSHKRNKCNSDGYRRPGSHWTFQIALSPTITHQPPILRTVDFQRLSENGIDFIMKKGVGSALLEQHRPVSILHVSGHYSPGEQVEQWRADGHCLPIDLHLLMDVVPHSSITGMVASKRAVAEQEYLMRNDCPVVSKDRQPLVDTSHFIELIQRTRLQLENGDISNAEIEESVQAYRFVPNRIERMIGGPDQFVWDRWEWLRGQDDSNYSDRWGDGDYEGTTNWNAPSHLLPY